MRFSNEEFKTKFRFKEFLCNKTAQKTCCACNKNRFLFHRSFYMLKIIIILSAFAVCLLTIIADYSLLTVYFFTKLLITGTNAFISSEFSFSLNDIIFSGVPSAICLIIFSSVVFVCQFLSVKSVDSNSLPKSVGFPFLSWQSLQCLIYKFIGSILASFARVIL